MESNNIELITRMVIQAINQNEKKGDGFMVPIGVSARHIHLTQEHVEALFGPGYQLTKKKELMGGQFASNETVTIVGLKLRAIENVRILGPVRKASKLPEYPVVMAMKGVGKSLGPQLMAEIGDVSRFTHKGAITAFAGVDPGVNESGSYEQKSVPASKRGSSTLRKTLFQVMDVLIKTKPQDDPVYLFMDKKRAQGKPYYVYMTAGANKFLRIYYGRVKEYLSSLPE